MAFHEVLFPPSVAWGASGGPKFKTGVYTADSGYEARTLDWKRVRGEWEVAHTLKTVDAAKDLTDFFYARRGMAYGFRFKDWNDYKLKNETISLGDGSTDTFQVTKTYASTVIDGEETEPYTRVITRLAWNTMAGVTVGGELAFRSYVDNWSDVSSSAPAYQLDENTGRMTLREPPKGQRYEGVTPASTYTFNNAGAFSSFVGAPNANAIPAAYVDGGYLWCLGNASGGATGLRKIDISTGVEVEQVTSATIGFPQTDPIYDDQQISAISAIKDGFAYVTVGGFNTQVLYKVDLSDYSIVASYGDAAGGLPDPGEIGMSAGVGSVCADGTRVINMGQLGGTGSITVHDTEDLGLIRIAPVGNLTIALNPIRAACPLYDYNFAILLSFEPSSGDPMVQVWDDAGNKLLQFEGVGMWIVRDVAPGHKGFIVGFRETLGGPAWAAKYTEEDQKEIWRVRLPGSPGHIHPQSAVNGRLIFHIPGNPGGVVVHMDTITGDYITRATDVAFISNGQFYNGATDQIITSPQSGSVSRRLDVNVFGLNVLPADSLTIGYCEFHVPVRFDTDQLDITQDHYGVSSWGSIPLVEVRDWSEITIR
jgi:uncharacterized protein (TIGR02217 family)